MYTKNKKPNWFLICAVLLTILIVCLYVKIKGEPQKVVVSDKEIIGEITELDHHLCTIDDTSIGQDNDGTAGVFKQVNSYLNQSSLGDAQINGVVVTESQQDFEEKTFDISEREEYILAKLVECEAGNQDMDAKEAVVMTIINRVDDTRFPDTVEDVIRQNDDGVFQFSPMSDDGTFYYTEPSEESYEAIHNVQYLISDKYLWFDCLYFESFPPDVSNWHSENLEFVIQYGDMRFYR